MENLTSLPLIAQKDVNLIRKNMAAGNLSHCDQAGGRRHKVASILLCYVNLILPVV